MCLAIPAKISKIDGKKVTASYPDQVREVLYAGEEPLKVGDYVLIQMGVVVQILSEKEANQVMENAKENPLIRT